MRMIGVGVGIGVAIGVGLGIGIGVDAGQSTTARPERRSLAPSHRGAWSPPLQWLYSASC